MEGNTRSSDTSQGQGKALEGYTVHLLSLDGTITTVRRQEAGGNTTVALTVETLDGKAEREVPAAVAQNVRSPEFTRVVREVKAALLARRRRKGRRRAK